MLHMITTMIQLNSRYIWICLVLTRESVKIDKYIFEVIFDQHD